ncbi:MAG: hypothetical protein GC182_08965 [Rhodopseudomonas sp.]|nr:hypothetical protein [Rhodopseudomonas sp.]
MSRHIATVIRHLEDSGAHKAVKFVNPNLVVSACRKRIYGGVKDTSEYVVKVGRPNYGERQFIASCIKAGISFPVRKVRIKFAAPKTRKRK